MSVPCLREPGRHVEVVHRPVQSSCAIYSTVFTRGQQWCLYLVYGSRVDMQQLFTDQCKVLVPYTQPCSLEANSGVCTLSMGAGSTCRSRSHTSAKFLCQNVGNDSRWVMRLGRWLSLIARKYNCTQQTTPCLSRVLINVTAQIHNSLLQQLFRRTDATDKK